MESESCAPVRDLLERSGFPLRHRLALKERSLETVAEAKAAQRLAEEALRKRGAIVALLGPRGTGKTQLAAILAHNCAVWAQPYQGRHYDLPEWMEDSCSPQEPEPVDPHVLAGWTKARYWRLADLFSDAKRAFSDGGDPLGDAAQAGLLVVDEIGETTDSAFEYRELVRLIDRRYGELRPTILVGNLTAAELSRFGESVVSRMQEAGTVIECNWKSWRTGA